jgi:hypothetical protein
MEKLEIEIREYVNRIAKEIKKKSIKPIKWKNDLFLLIKETFDIISQEYALDDNKKNELISSFNNKAIERISDSRSKKYLELNRQQLKTTKDKVAVLLGNESFYSLNEEEIIELLIKDFFSPFIDELKLNKFSGGHLTKEKIILYGKIFERFDTENQNGNNPSWTDVFNWVSKSKDENGDPLISDELDRKKQRKTFCNFRSRNKLYTAQDFEKYLASKNYPKLKS